MKEHKYQFVIIDITKDLNQYDIADLLVDGEYDVDLYIYTKSPVSGNVRYADDDSSVIHSASYTCTCILLHNNVVHLQKSGNHIGLIKSHKSLEDAVAVFNDLVKKYLSPDSYRLTEDVSEMEIHSSIIEDIGRYLCVKDEETGDYKPSPYLLTHTKIKKDIYKYFILPDNRTIYK